MAGMFKTRFKEHMQGIKHNKIFQIPALPNTFQKIFIILEA
jgi:hypothetical protein